MLDIKMKLSPHFSLEEFIVSQVAQRFAIDNTPPEDVISNLKHLCETILEPARQALGPLRVSSGYRCLDLNTRIGGSINSAHIYGHAADILPISCSKIQFARWVVDHVKFDQVILEFGTIDDPSWIHVSSDPRMRSMILRTAQTQSGFSEYSFK